MTEANAQTRNPEAGMLAIVRKRRGIISEVREFDGEDGRHHLVRIKLEIEADSSTGFVEGTKRAVKENCNALKFKKADLDRRLTGQRGKAQQMPGFRFSETDSFKLKWPTHYAAVWTPPSTSTSSLASSSSRRGTYDRTR